MIIVWLKLKVVCMKHEIINKFSGEVDKQISQFGIDIIEDISNEIDAELISK